jgi:raffinose/stachyose/melibiose transport system substrate-binding protein
LVDLTDEAFEANVIDSFKPTVTANGRIYGAPWGSAMGGGVVYNKKIYEKLGLSVPTSWAEFMANSQKIKDAGIPPVIQSFGTDWSAQIFVLADFYNVITADPSFAVDYTANKAKYATTPAALAGFQHQEDVFKAGFLNKDFASATLDDALRMVAKGEGAQYPQLSFAISNIKENYPDDINDIGYFAMPGAPEHNGLTVWMPGALYIAKTSQHIEEAKKFATFLATTAGCAALSRKGVPTGPYLVKGCSLPDQVPPAVKDLLPYFQADGRTAPALEFLSPVKGPLMPQITTEVGSGTRSALEGAKLYDEDVRKQAMQLGLPGW